jgi:hypothetical protein
MSLAISTAPRANMGSEGGVEVLLVPLLKGSSLSDLESYSLEIASEPDDLDLDGRADCFLAGEEESEVVPRVAGEALDGFDGRLPELEEGSEGRRTVAVGERERAVGRGDGRRGALGPERGEEEAECWPSELYADV